MKDTTSDCFPGVTYTQTNRFEFETGRYVPITISNISLPGHDSVMTSRFSKAGGTATVEGVLSGYRTTNYCLPTAPQKEPERPVQEAARQDRRRADTRRFDDQRRARHPGGTRLMLSIERRGRGSEDLTCAGAGAQSVQSVDKNAVVTTSFAPGVRGPAVGARRDQGLQPASQQAAAQGDRHRRPVRLGDRGCVAPPARSPDRGSLNADGDCRLTGKVVLNVRTIQ